MAVFTRPQKFQSSNCKIVNKTAPGIPNILTNKMVIKFNPIWKLKDAPTRLMIYIKSAPNKEFAKSLIINFKGTIKILPNTNKIHIPDK